MVVNNMITVQEFYSGKPLTLKNGESLTIQEILDKDNSWWDGCHDFIQWIFPTITVSKYCLNAPVLTEEDAKYIHENHRNLFFECVDRFVLFLDDIKMREMNHNHLRITRVLESITLVLGEVSINLFITLLAEEKLPHEFVYEEYSSIIRPVYDKVTLNYWNNALNAHF